MTAKYNLVLDMNLSYINIIKLYVRLTNKGFRCFQWIKTYSENVATIFISTELKKIILR